MATLIRRCALTAVLNKISVRPMSNIPTLTQLHRGLAISEQIASLEAELAAIFAGSPLSKSLPAKASVAAKSPVTKKKGGMSPEGRARIVAAQKARWAKIKKAKTSAAKAQAAKAPAKKKGGLTPEGKAKLAAAMKARWAAAKAGTGPAPTAGKKK